METYMRNCLQTGCLIIGILCFIYYAAVTAYAGLQTDFAWIWVAGGVFFLTLWRLFLYEASHPHSWAGYALVVSGVLIAAGIAGMLFLGSRIVSGMRAKTPKALDYVIVLGAHVSGEEPSRALLKRLEAAYTYAEKNQDTVLLLSGGKGSGEDISEAECMFRYLSGRGIGEERLIKEDRSTTTKENLEFCAALPHETPRESRTGILSNDFHVYRALALAKKQGYEAAYAIPAAGDPLMEAHYVLREMFAIVKELLTGSMEL